MIERGMDLARINCAHDGPEAWRSMIEHLRAAETATGKRCLVSMDLAGPKLRTGPVRPGPRVLRVKPVRNEVGAVVEPGRVWLGSPPVTGPGSALPAVPLDDNAWAGSRRRGQEIRLDDARGARHTLFVRQVGQNGCLVSLHQTVYFAPGIRLTVPMDPVAGKKGHGQGRQFALVAELPALEERLLIHQGDSIVLSSDLTPADNTTVGTHRIGCTLASALADAHTGKESGSTTARSEE